MCLPTFEVAVVGLPLAVVVDVEKVLGIIMTLEGAGKGSLSLLLPNADGREVRDC